MTSTTGATPSGASRGRLAPSLQRAGPFLFVAGLGAVTFAELGPQQFANALTIGAIYALVALGYTMVYGIIELINFAHGEVFMVGSFISMYFLTTGLGQRGAIGDPLLLVLVIAAAFLVTMLVNGVLGVIIERFAYRPLRNAPRLAPLITAIGVSFILQNIVQVVFGRGNVSTPQLVSLNLRFEFLGASIGFLNVFIVVVAVGMMVGLQLFINKTKLGRAMRSTAQDREAAQLMGVDINQTIAATFFLAAALAGAAGVIQGLYFGNIHFTLGFLAGLKAFTAAVLGGIGNITGAALGGFVIGFVEVAAARYGVFEWGPAIVFVVLIVVLVFRPTGLLGQVTAERA